MANPEIDCITSCVLTPPNPFLAFVHYFLLALIAFSILFLILSKNRLSAKRGLVLKSIILLSILLLLISFAFTRPTFLTIFSTVHNVALVLIVVFFLLSYWLAVPIARLGMKTVLPSESVSKLFEKEKKELGLPHVNLSIILETAPVAFVVSGFEKRIFLSKGTIEKMNSEELSRIFHHELLHLKSPFFKIKRVLQSIKAGFFFLLPITFDELDDFEEEKLDEQMKKEKKSVKEIRKKMAP